MTTSLFCDIVSLLRTRLMISRHLARFHQQGLGLCISSIFHSLSRENYHCRPGLELLGGAVPYKVICVVEIAKSIDY